MLSLIIFTISFLSIICALIFIPKKSNYENRLPMVPIASDFNRMNRRRVQYNTNIGYNTQNIISDIEYNWSDKVRGLLCDKNEQWLYTADKNYLNRLFRLESVTTRDLSSTALQNYDRRQRCPCDATNSDVTGYGQGTNYSFFNNNENNLLFPVVCGQNTQLLLLGSNFVERSNVPVVLRNLRARWISQDPISKFIIMPHSFDFNAVYAYDLTKTPDSFSVRFVKQLPLLNSFEEGVGIERSYGSTFDSDGRLYILSDNNSNSKAGIYIFQLDDNFTKFTLKAFIKLGRPSPLFEYQSDFRFVVLTFMNDFLYRRRKYLTFMIRNNDNGIDNIYIKRLLPYLNP